MHFQPPNYNDMVEDPVLTIRFIFEDRKYRPDELVGSSQRGSKSGGTLT